VPVVIFLIGLIATLYGCYIIAPALAFIVGGVLFMAVAINVERSSE